MALAAGLLKCVVLLLVLLLCSVDRSPCWGRGSWLFCFPLVFGLCTVCLGLFAVPLGVIGRLYSVIVANHGHFSLLFP